MKNSSLRVLTRFRLVLIVVLLFGLILVPMNSVAAAGVRYAKPTATGTGDCLSWVNACTLQNALTNASSGDETWVMQGTHTAGTARTATFLLKSGVAVYGGFAGTETARDARNYKTNVTTLSGEIGAAGTSDNAYHVVTGSGTNGTTILDGFTITAGNADQFTDPNHCGGGMYNSAGSPMLENVTFSGNFAYIGGGMANYNSSNPFLKNVTFSGNSADNGGGIYNSAGSPILENVTFSGNSSYWGGAMANIHSSPILTNVILWGNTAYSGAQSYNDSTSTATITNNRANVVGKFH